MIEGKVSFVRLSHRVGVILRAFKSYWRVLQKQIFFKHFFIWLILLTYYLSGDLSRALPVLNGRRILAGDNGKALKECHGHIKEFKLFLVVSKEPLKFASGAIT